jgi:MFS family permease
MVGGWLAMAVAMLHLGTARTLWHVALATAVLSACHAFVRPAMNAAIADVVPDHDRRRAYGLQYWALNLGFAFAAVLAGQLIKLSYLVVFILDATTSVVTAAFLALLYQESRPGHGEAARGTRRLDLTVLRDRTFLAIGLMSLCSALAFQQAHVSLAAEITRDGLTTAYGWIIAVNGVLIVLLQPFVVRQTEAHAARHVLALGMVLIGAGFFATAFADTAWQHVLPIVVWTMGEMFLAATTPTVVARLAPTHLRATYVGMHQLSWSVAAFGPALGAWLLDRHGSFALWGGVLAVCLLAAAWVFRLRDPRLAS